MPGILKVGIFLLVFIGVTAGIAAFIVPEGNPSVKAKGKICDQDIDFTVTGNKAALETDISLTKLFSLAAGLLIAVITLFIL